MEYPGLQNNNKSIEKGPDLIIADSVSKLPYNSKSGSIVEVVNKGVKKLTLDAVFPHYFYIHINDTSVGDIARTDDGKILSILENLEAVYYNSNNLKKIIYYLRVAILGLIYREYEVLENLRWKNLNNIKIFTFKSSKEPYLYNGEEWEKMDYVQKSDFAFDNTPTQDSSSLLTSGVIYNELSNKADLINGKVPSDLLPSYVDDVLEFPSIQDFPEFGESGKIYIDIDTNTSYRWTGSIYKEIQSPIELDEYPILGSTNAIESGGVYSALLRKLDIISDLPEIRLGAALGATALLSFTETDPTVPAWAKLATKPSYTASEVGALPDSTIIPDDLYDLNDDSTHRLVTDTEKATWNSKQDELISGTNIKTINNTSILGSGDISVSQNGIASITAVESQASGGNNVVTITETNGNTTAFNIKNGNDGVSLGEIALVLTTGDATDEVMSQKAVTEYGRKVTAEDLNGTSEWIKARLTSAGWLLGKYIKSDGTAVNDTGCCVTPYIQIGDLSNHILEISFGFVNGNRCIALYTSSGSKVTYYGATSNPRTVTLGSISTATQLRVTFNINDIPKCYIYDKTADEYIIKGDDVIVDILKNNLVNYKLFKDTLVVQNSGNSDRTVMSQKAVGEAIEDAPLRKMKFNNYAVFGAYTDKTCTSVDTYNIDELKVITSLRVVDTFGANNPSYYNYGLRHILGIVRASSPTTDYLSLYGDGYNLYLWFKKNGTDVLKYSLGNSNGRKILRTFARIDLYGKTISLYSKGGDGTYLTLVENYDISELDLSNLQEVKIVTSVGTSHNDKMLFNHVQINNYIIDPKAQLDTVVNYGEYSKNSSHKLETKAPTPSTLMFTNEGEQTGITVTLNDPLHKIITVDRDTAGLVYNFGFYSFSHSPSHMQTYAYEIYKVKFTNVTSNLLIRGWSENSMGSSYILNPETYAYTKIPMDATTGTVLEYEIEEGKTYFFIYVIGSGYHTRYNHYLGGHFTMEITEPTTYCVGSMNLCGEYYDGQYFCGHIPFKSGENFIPSVYGQFNDTYNLPAMKGRMRLSGANVLIYNGSAWKQINNS